MSLLPDELPTSIGLHAVPAAAFLAHVDVSLALLTTVTTGFRQARSDVQLATALPASRRSVGTGGDLKSVSWILTRTLRLPA